MVSSSGVCASDITALARMSRSRSWREEGREEGRGGGVALAYGGGGLVGCRRVEVVGEGVEEESGTVSPVGLCS